ncbi:MAG: hypothetical protein ACR2RV_06165 [Verrucomicrobiales bacterium]
MMKFPRLTSIAALILAAGTPESSAQGDDFNDGEAGDWTDLIPLAPLPGGTSFPNGDSYRLQSDPSPNEEDLGPARIGSTREDVTYSDFYQFVDLVDYDGSLDQNIGMLSRVTDAGAGTTNGYAVTYNPIEQKIYLSVIRGEAGENLAEAEVFVPEGDPIRLVFTGVGDDLKLEIFALPNTSDPVGSIETSDPTWGSGTSGVFVAADPADTPIPVDCTFDNYFAASEEPLATGVTSIELESSDLVFEFLSNPNRTYGIWESANLVDWAELNDSIPAALDVKTRFSMPKPDLLMRYYQFRVVD